MRLDLRPTLNAFLSVQRLHDAGDSGVVDPPAPALAWIITPGDGAVTITQMPYVPDPVVLSGDGQAIVQEYV